MGNNKHGHALSYKVLYYHALRYILVGGEKSLNDVHDDITNTIEIRLKDFIPDADIMLHPEPYI